MYQKTAEFYAEKKEVKSNINKLELDKIFNSSRVVNVTRYEEEDNIGLIDIESITDEEE